jgi:hypothetical protein
MKLKAFLPVIVLALVLAACGYNPVYAPSPSPTPLPPNQQHTIVTTLPAIDTSPDSESQSLPDYINTDYLIASQDDVDVYFIDAYKDANSDDCYEILIHNRSSKTLFANCVNIAINGMSLLPYISAKADAGAYYLYRDSLPAEHGSFLSEYGKAANIQIEMHFADYSDNSMYTYIDEMFVIDENAQITKPDFKGQIIYNENDFIIGIEKIADANGISSIMLYYENNSDESLVVLIESLIIGSHDLSHQTPLSITHNSYVYWPVELDEPITDKEYEVTVYYAIVGDISESVEGLEGEVLSFTLR